MEALPKPVVLGSFIEDKYQPPVPGLRLRWDSHAFGAAERCWHLPQHLTLTGPAPERFGVTITRLEDDAYAVRLLWNEMCFVWNGLSRVQLLTSALTALLRAFDQDLWRLLNQPLNAVAAHPPLAA